MPPTVLGISAYYHDSAACITRAGDIIAAAQEERFTRRKHEAGFPSQAINYCLEEAFVEAADLDAIVFYDNPLLTWDRVLESCLTAGEKGVAQFEVAAPSILGRKLWIQDQIADTVGSLGKAGRLLITEHHMAHAASAFFPSPFQEAAILTLDGVGEWATTTFGAGTANRIELTHEIRYPHSLGLLYSSFTFFCGFRVNSGEYKLMGLAPYGEPRYTDLIRETLIAIEPDGSFLLNTEYFGFVDDLQMTNTKFDSLLGGPPRLPESPITRRECDLAASIQKVLEDVVIRLAQHVRRETGLPNLVLAGGVALNCVANGRILAEQIFDDLWIQPAAGDAGGALGAALLTAHEYFGVPRDVTANARDTQKGSLLGPSYSPAEVRAFLDTHDCAYEVVADKQTRIQTVAQALSDGLIVGYFSGRMEFGPRALGARSILGDPRQSETQTVMNLKIKYRESFRPFAPSVAYDCAANYFELDRESPYMLLVVPVRNERRLQVETPAARESADLLEIVRQARSDIPAVTHVDYSARVQTVHPDDNPDYYDIINEFGRLTGTALVVNTSFNVRGEPIVCSPKDAYSCFMNTEIDLLVLENCLLWKSQQLAHSRRGTPEQPPVTAPPRSPGLRQFYEDILLPLADKRDPLPGVDSGAEPEVAGGTHFRMRSRVSNERHDFELLDYVDEETLTSALEDMWTALGNPELAALSARIAALAVEQKRASAVDTDSVSPFIYAMF